MKKNRSFLIAILIIAFAVISISVLKNSFSNKIKTDNVKIAYLPVVQGLPLYIAIDKGYFKDEGINVEAVKFESPNQVIDALISGQVQIGSPGTASGITAISQVAKPESIKIFSLVGGGLNTTNDLLLAKDKKIQSVGQLKGKKLGILPGIQFQTIAKQILIKNNLSPEKDVTIIELAIPLQIQALASGQVDALLTVEPIGTIGKSKGLFVDVIKSPMVQYISDPWYGAAGDISTQFAKDYPETAKKILKVFSKATKEINDDPDASKQYLKNYVSIDENLISQVPLPVYKMYHNFNNDDLNALQKFSDIFTENKVVDRKIDARQLIYSDQTSYEQSD